MPNQSLSWPAFLATLDPGLAILAARVQQATPDPARFGAPVLYRPTAGRAATNEVLIGVGQIAEEGQAGICLNNKGAHFVTGQPTAYASVTDLVLGQHPRFWDAWRERVGSDTTPERFFARFNLVVEDASPDSCFALIVFLALLAGVAAADIPRRWSDYIRRWEQGDVISTGQPLQSYGALHNALAHSYFSGAWGHAWIDCLGLLLGALRVDAVPAHLTTDNPWPPLQKAHACLAFEQQVYEDSLAHATCVQLALPLRGAAGRFRLVDAYLAEEPVPLGSLKVFLRTDTVHTHLKQGFTLMALHKPWPSEAGSGNDMSVSVTPQAGVHLEDLWQELEAMEDAAWVEGRPHDRPRLSILGYPEGRRPDGEPAPDEPWYDGGDYTLVAAPRRLATGDLGSKLDWHAVREAVWRVYNPLQKLQVIGYGDGGCVTLENCPLEPFDGASAVAASGKRLVIARWRQGAAADLPDHAPFLRFTPTLKRYLAAILSRSPTASGPIQLHELPGPEHCDLVELSGGFAVIADGGAFVIDDWRREALLDQDIRQEFAGACKLLQGIQASAHKVGGLTQTIYAYLHGDAPGEDERILLNRLTDLRIGLSRLQAETLPQSFDPSVRQFRQMLEARWSIAGRLEEFHRAANQIDAILDNYVALRTNRRVAFLTLYGFPVVLAATLFSFIFTDLKPTWPVDASAWGSIHWVGLVLFMLLTGVGIGVVHLIIRYQDRRARLGKPNDTSDDPPSR